MLPCGTYNIRYETDIAIVRTKLQWGMLIGAVILSFVIPIRFLDMAWLGWLMNVCAIIVAVLGLHLLTGLCGQINLGQAAFMAVGAYSAAILMSKLGWSYWAVLPIAGLLTGLVGMIFGAPSLRIKGFYLAMATLAAQFIIIFLIVHEPLRAWTGGYLGFDCPTPSLGAITFDTYEKLFIPMMAITWLMIYFAKNIQRTRVGRAFIAIRDNDLAAEVLESMSLAISLSASSSAPSLPASPGQCSPPLP